jgi:hypothetical protein
VVVSFAAEESWDALLGVKTAEAGTADGGALCFLLCSIQVTVGGGSSIQLKNSSIYRFNLQSNVVTSISLSLLVQI